MTNLFRLRLSDSTVFDSEAQTQRELVDMSQSKPSGLSAALGHEQFGLETCRRAHVESLTAERLGPNGVNNIYDVMHKNTLLYLRIEVLSYLRTSPTRL